MISGSSLTQTQIAEALQAFGLRAGDIVFVHSSLSSIGTTEGGANTVVDAFLEVLGPEGILVVPMFTFAHGQEPSPVFNLLATRSLQRWAGLRSAPGYGPARDEAATCYALSLLWVCTRTRSQPSTGHRLGLSTVPFGSSTNWTPTSCCWVCPIYAVLFFTFWSSSYKSLTASVGKRRRESGTRMAQNGRFLRWSTRPSQASRAMISTSLGNTGRTGILLHTY